MDEEFWKTQAEFYQSQYFKQQEITDAYRKVTEDLMWLLNEKSRGYTNLKLELEKQCKK